MSTQKKIPLRKCLATNEMFPKKEMIRIVRSKEGEVSVDLTGKKSGRGAYISKSEKAIQVAKKRKVLDNQLEVKVPDTIYEELEEIISKEGTK